MWVDSRYFSHDRDAGQDEESQYCDAGMNGISKDALSISKSAKLSDSKPASFLIKLQSVGEMVEGGRDQRS